MKNTKSYIFAVDFDGYLCKDEFPAIGKPNKRIIKHFIKLKESGHQLILNTCRVNDRLTEAVAWCKHQGLEFDAVNENLPQKIKTFGSDCRKISADYYCDDRSYWLMPKDSVGRKKCRLQK